MHPKHSTGFGFLCCAMRQTKHLTESIWSAGASCEPRTGQQFLHLLLVSSAEQGNFQKNDFQRVISSSLFTQTCSTQRGSSADRWGEGWRVGCPLLILRFPYNSPKPLQPSPRALQTKALLPTPLGQGEKGKIHARTSAGSFQREPSSLIQWSVPSSPSLPRFGEYKWTQWPDMLSRAPIAPQQRATLSSSASSPTPLANHGHHLTHQVMKYLQLEGC